MSVKPPGEDIVNTKQIFILIALVLILIVTGSFMIYKNQSYDKIIGEQKLQIEELSKEIEAINHVKMQIDLYREETQSIKKEIENLKSKKGKL